MSITQDKNTELAISINNLGLEIREGNKEAFNQLAVKAHPILFIALSKIMKDRVEMEEIYLAVLLEIWDKIQKFNPEKGNFVSWIITMTKRRAIDHYRVKIARLESSHKYMMMMGNNVPICRIESSSSESYEGLYILLGDPSIPIEQKTVLELHWLKEMSQREISDHLKIPLGTIKTRLELGLNKLKALNRSRPSILTK